MIKEPFYCYGFGNKIMNRFCSIVGLNKNSNELTFELLFKNYLRKLKKRKSVMLDYRLSFKHQAYIEFLSTVGNYKFIRRCQGLPARGQRTHTNSNTCKKHIIKIEKR